jgi:tetratricopeptide (TPR) repeat protein
MGAAPVVLVAAERRDPTADMVVSALTKRGAAVFRFDVADFPQRIHLDAQVRDGLSHARTAFGHANLGNRQAALRSLGYAQEALGKADTTGPRPSWMAFYGLSELTAMTAILRDRIGDSAEAEGAWHQALSAIPQQFRRNRALATTRLALAQLHQRDIDQACATASTVFELMSGNPIPGRMRSLLGDYYRELITLAPDAGVARERGDRYRSEWSRA